MKVLITGAKGFVGRNLVEALKNIRDGKDRREQYASLQLLEIFEYDLNSTPEQLDEWCQEADFVFNLAGVNRPEDPADFMKGNFGFASDLLNCLEKHGNKCPVMLASSAQATLKGRYAGSKYGESKLAGEQLFREYEERTGAPVLIYRFPNLYGKWCRPNYNSAIATFCNNIANDLPITVNDPSVELETLYIDDLVTEMLNALAGHPTKVEEGDQEFCVAQPTDDVTLGEIVELLEGFKVSRETREIPNVADGSFSKKLLSTYESYIAPENAAYSVPMNCDPRGSFTELFKTPERGQVSVNVSKPGVTKGNHWHNTKWEKFVVVSGKGLIQMRKVGTDAQGNGFPVTEFRVSGDDITVVDMLPGYTHNIINLSDTDDLVTVMWANECFDPENPDTFFEEV